jgi:hypothetical protein
MTTAFWSAAQQHTAHVRRRLRANGAAYDGEGAVNLPGYAGSLLAFAVTTTGLVATGRLRGQQLPERYALADVALGGLATHKFTRLLSKASVTSPLRAPFTTFEEAAGSSELNEQARGDGVRHTVGELVTCPFCLGQWVGTGYVAGLALAPRVARTWAAVFAVTALSDFLQQAYARVQPG